LSFVEGVGSFTTHPATCSECGRPIAFKQGNKRPLDVIGNGSEFFQITDVSHFDSCPTKIRKRLEERCAFCQLDAGKDILSIGNLIDYMKCQSHSNEKVEISYRGKSLPMNSKTLHLMHDDALKTRKRKEKAKESGIGNEPMDVFLE